jgi:hypothetical protein
MKEIKNVTLYQCDFCSFKRQRKWALLHHEAHCSKNPKNQHPCFNCEHLKVDTYWDEHAKIEGGEIVYVDGPTLKKFICTKLDKMMYSFKAEKMSLPEKYPDDFEDNERMPPKDGCIFYSEKRFDFETLFDF